MKITAQQIRGIMGYAQEQRIAEFVRYFNEYADTFGIDTKLRAVHFIAQVAHETAELRYLEEIASGAAYEGRKDLGNTQRGDGARFKGRGLLQLTGRANYQRYADSGFCVGDLMSHPEWLAKYPGAMKSAMWFWKTRGLNEMADRDDVEGITRRVNGGTNGMAQRKFYWRRGKRVFWI